jgi:hypothetical protein
MEDTTVLDNVIFQTTIGGGVNIGASGSTININHADTSSVSNSDNSNGVVLQDITFDTFGHVQTIGTTDLDSRYVSTITSGDGIAVTGGATNSATVAVNYAAVSGNLIHSATTVSAPSGGNPYTPYILIAESNPGVPNGAVNKIQLQNIPLSDFGDADADIDMGGNKILDVANPTSAQDAATKSYVDNAIVGSLSYEGGYDASVAPPTGTGVKQGYVYAVTASGNGAGFFTITLRPGDMVIAQQDNPTTEAHWTEIQSNVDYATAGSTVTAKIGLSAFNSEDFTVSQGGFVSGKDATASTPGLARVTAAGGLEVDTVNAGNFVISLDESSGGNPLSKTIPLVSSATNISSSISGGVQTYALTITSGFYGSNVVPKDLMVQVQETVSGNVVFTEIEKSSTTLNIKFNGTTSSGQYTVLLIRAN